jgi:hypothetical protein
MKIKLFTSIFLLLGILVYTVSAAFSQPYLDSRLKAVKSKIQLRNNFEQGQLYVNKIDSLIEQYKERPEVLNLLLQKTNNFSKKVPDNQKYFAVRLVLDYL